MNTTIPLTTPCPDCRNNDCPACVRPSGSRLDANDVERATCCCGRRFRAIRYVNNTPVGGDKR